MSTIFVPPLFLHHLKSILLKLWYKNYVYKLSHKRQRVQHAKLSFCFTFKKHIVALPPPSPHHLVARSLFQWPLSLVATDFGSLRLKTFTCHTKHQKTFL